MGLRIGIDVGGSALKIGALSRSGDVAFRASVPTATEASAENVFDDLTRALRAHVTDPIESVGVGLPGALDRVRGVIEVSPNLPWLRGVPMRDELAKRLGIDVGRVALENDANVAALGECRFGRGRDFDSMLFVTLGTGVGSGLVLDGALHTGAGLACEIGHVCIDPTGIECGCGSRGCLETEASATAARRRAIAAGLPSDDPGNLELLTERGRAASGPERALLEAIGRDLGYGLAAFLVLVDVRAFVFGGGFAAALDVLRPGIEAGIAARSFGARDVTLVGAALGNDAGWMGAASLAD